ncbi:nitroreductase family protein [Desulfogranum mediterraneum]|uniref:nitroreductase family protein n=1 Tax=Desulfogranum mediterraneum TaxID=160661 RepID=UPI00040A3D6E|nr:nitroreductase family protein [Desulfogranum mediterraneum]
MLIKLLRKRRSIRRFSNQAVSRQDLDLLLEAALRSPSSKGINPWEFLVIQEQETIRQLATAKPHGAAFLKNAPLAVVVCADSSKTDVWVEDASIAALILHLAAADLGLGSCWAQIRLREHDAEKSAQEYLSRLLNLPEQIMVEAIIGIGHPVEEKPGHSEESLLQNQVHFERFSN